MYSLEYIFINVCVLRERKEPKEREYLYIYIILIIYYKFYLNRI